MRKLVAMTTVDKKTFQPILKIRMNDSGVSSELFTGKMEVHKYTAEETAKINMFNKALLDNDMPLMSDEEADWSVGMHLKNIPEPTIEELQHLAGYRVEKKIIYLDKELSNEL